MFFKSEGIFQRVLITFIRVMREKVSTVEMLIDPYPFTREERIKRVERSIHTNKELTEEILKIRHDEARIRLLRLMDKRLDLTEKRIERLKVPESKEEKRRIRAIREAYTHVAPILAEEITKETLFPFKDIDREYRRSIADGETIGLENTYEYMIPLIKTYKRDEDLRVFFYRCLEEEIRKNEIYLKELKEFKQTWDELPK